VVAFASFFVLVIDLFCVFVVSPKVFEFVVVVFEVEQVLFVRGLALLLFALLGVALAEVDCDLAPDLFVY
jgi:hypothetical protein